MPTEITTVVNQQDLEVEVGGPAPANRMYLVSGIGKVDLAVLQPDATVKKTGLSAPAIRQEAGRGPAASGPGPGCPIPAP